MGIILSSDIAISGSISSVSTLAWNTYYRMKTWGGSTTGNSSFTISVGAVGSQATLKITAGFSHYGAAFTSYGCVKSGVYNYYHNNSTEVDAIEVTSAGGGSWSFNISSNNLSIVKNAGNYAGGGYYIVSIEGLC